MCIHESAIDTKLILAVKIDFFEKIDDKIEFDLRETFDIFIKGQVKDLNISSSGIDKKMILKSLTNNFPFSLEYPKVEPGYPFPQIKENSEISSVSNRNLSSSLSGHGRFLVSISALFTLIYPQYNLVQFIW